ncbi:expressed unknown protein [Seminavis robusta]|uniref:Uncharacterized protein n=1 Tax=Seminavis robusta TaxID=568900 RepID=A0A9N8H3S5_9STRA|nr:expressed unknown protein [Seminavis robusta]|eukprot:Sro32_g021120.1 n/a (356) ;mRNA; r:156171-157238
MATEGSANGLSYLASWMAGGSPPLSTNPPATQDEEPISAKNTTVCSLSTLDALARDDLIRELREKLQKDSSKADATYTLHAWELRLLVGLPSNTSTTCSTAMRTVSASDVAIVAEEVASPESESSSVPPIMEPLETSPVFSNWDITSFFGSEGDHKNESSLSSEEVQAIMIALAAEEQDPTSRQQWPSFTRPQSMDARQISIQSFATREGDLEIMVLLDQALQDQDDVDTTPTRPGQVTARQVSIQETTTRTDTTSPGPDPIKMQGRQASVRPAAPSKFVVTFPSDTNHHKEERGLPKPATGIRRQVSVQPSHNNTTEPAVGTSTSRPPTTNATHRQVSVRLDGGESKLSFQFVI